MVVLIGQLDAEILRIPRKSLLAQLLETLFVKLIADSDCQDSAHFALEIDEPSQAEGEDYL